jgi:SAM-dependent methyltransferase
MADALNSYLSIWDRKPVLRLVYNDIFDRIAARCVAGTTLEIGGGIGNFKERLPNVISSDIQFGRWLDIVADAQRLPFRDGSLSNIVMLDVLHHIEFPLLFLREAARALRPGGRIVMVEPGITLGSTLFFRLVHQEPVIMSANPLLIGEPDPDRDPYFSNQAIPTLISGKFRDQFHAALPGMRIVEDSWFSFAVYPLSGGFKPWSLLSERLASAGLKLEKRLEKLLGRYLGFRVLVVIEKEDLT